jgi:threonine dehydratase
VPQTSAGAAADSLGPPQIGRIAFETAEKHGTTSLLVSEEEVVAARRFLWERVRVLAEPGASVALAAVMAGKVEAHPGTSVVVVVSGGNNPAMP